MDENISSAVLNEALNPTVTDDAFIVLGKTVRIMPLKVKYQSAMAKVLEPLFGDMAFDISIGHQVLEVLTKVGAHYDVLPALVRILAENDGITISEEEMGESTLQPSDFAAILLAFAKKNKEVGEPVVNFFERVWPVLRERLVQTLQETEKTLAETSSPTT